MKKKASLLMLIFILSSCLLSCSSDKTDLPIVGVCFYKYDDSYLSTVRQSLEKLFEGKALLYINDGKGDSGTQMDQIDLLIDKKVDLLLVNMVDTDESEEVLKKAKSNDIPIVFFNRKPDEEVLNSYDKALYVGTDSVNAGVIQGDLITQIWNSGNYDKNKDGKMQYIIFVGEENNKDAQERTYWSVKTVNDNGINTQELGKAVCNWDIETANKDMEEYLTDFGDEIEFIISNDDSMAQGALAALQSAEYNIGDDDKYIPIVGIDATNASKELTDKGYITGTIVNDGELMAKVITDISFNIIKGKNYTEGINYVSSENPKFILIPCQLYKPDK